LLPDAPVPDGRTVLTAPDATSRPRGPWDTTASSRFIPVTNPLERSLGEVKRRTKVIGRFPGETSCLTLVWAVLDLYISHATNGINFTQLERQQLKRMRYEGHQQAVPEEVTAA
jgi:transposase-like protein